ncbi:MAG: GGDEF domain-containing protein, partial [Thermodesulfobacteriota bacterium]
MQGILMAGLPPVVASPLPRLAGLPWRKLWLTGEDDQPLALFLAVERLGATTGLAVARELAGRLPGLDGLPERLSLPELNVRLAAVEAELAQLRELSRTDPLTGLANVRRLQEGLRAELDRVGRTRLPLGLIMTDIDHFKAVNDTYGHETGNEALCTVAGIIRSQIRSIDTAARYGGEEFAIILPATGLARAKTVAERLRRAVRATAITAADGRRFGITASFGVAVASPGQDLAPEALISRADQELYRAKAAGRDRVSAPE